MTRSRFGSFSGRKGTFFPTRRFQVLLAATALALTTAASPTPENEQSHLQRMWASCVSNSPPNVRQSACTTILNVPNLLPARAAQALYSRAHAFAAQGQSDPALADLDAAAGLLPEKPEIWRARARLHMDLHHFAAAASDWGRVAELVPDNFLPLLMQGNMLDIVDKRPEARAVYDRAFELAPDDPTRAIVLTEHGVSFQSDHLWKESLWNLTEALRFNPEHDSALYARGRAHYLLGDTDAAIADFERLNSLGPGRIYYLLWLHLAEKRGGNDAAAAVRRHLRGRDLNEWPGPILSVFLGDLREDELNLPKGGDDWERKGQQCELSFFLGELALLNGRRDLAMDRFRTAVDTGIIEFVEHVAARWQLRNAGLD